MTFSIAARCRRTGMLGAAMATGLPAAGPYCLHVSAGVGAAVTQAYTNPYLGIDALRELRESADAEKALAMALHADPDTAKRQLLVVDARGRVAVHTGEDTFPWHGSIEGDGYVVAANMVPGRDLLEAMSRVYAETDGLDLWVRLVHALAAGESSVAGHLRPCRSAAVMVADREEYALFDLRVDLSANPIGDLLAGMPEVERLLPFVRMLPSRDVPSGSWDEGQLELLGLMPKPGE